jgi:CHAT domain-containing protein/tetratricopeptide (TPR) repeat protein
LIVEDAIMLRITSWSVVTLMVLLVPAAPAQGQVKGDLNATKGAGDEVLAEKARKLNAEGLNLFEAGKFKEASAKMTEALEIRRKLYPAQDYAQGHPDLAQSLNNLGRALVAQGEYAKAEQYYRDALAMVRALYPKDRYPQGHAQLARCLNNMGSLLEKLGEYVKAEPYYRDTLAMNQALYPKDRYPQGHVELAESLSSLGALLHQKGEYAKAEPYLRETLAMYQSLYPKDRYPKGHADLATSLNDLGVLLLTQGEYVKAEVYFRDALAMRQALYPKADYPQGHPDLALSLNNLAGLLRQHGDYAKAEPLYRDALAMYQALYSKDRYPQGHPDLATGLNTLGFVLLKQGEYAKAEPYVRDALAMRQALYPKATYPQGHPELATNLNSLAGLLESQGEYAKAEPYFRDALAMRQTLYPKSQYPQGHPDLALTLNRLGNLLESQRAYAKAEQCYRADLDMNTALYPKDRYPKGHPHLATSLNNLGTVLKAQKEYAKAEPYYRDALEMNIALYPKNRYPNGHPKLATGLNNLGSLFYAQGQYAKAATYYSDALAMFRGLYLDSPQGHPDLAASLRNLSVLLQAQGQYAKAAPYCREALGMQQFHFERMAEFAAEAETLNLAASVPVYLDDFLAIHRRLPEDAAVYDLVWKSRAPLTRIMQRHHLEMHASQDPIAKKLVVELQSARQRLARMLLSPAKDAAEHKKKLEEMTDAKEELEKRLARLMRLNLAVPPAQTSLQQLSKAVPEGAAFIDLIHYTESVWDPGMLGEKGRSHVPRFMAFVVLSGKPAQAIDLGEAAPIEKAWSKWREAIVGNQPDREAATALAIRVWQPLRKHLPPQIHTVWLAADGMLAQVPWAALPGARPNTILLEELAIALVPHGAFLVQRLQDNAAALAAKPLFLAVGGVAYDKAPAAADDAGLNLTFPPVVGDSRITWKSLPGTASERAQIVGLARQALQGEPLVLQGAAASIAGVSAELPKVRFAHLATHGFFADPKFRSAFQVDEKQFEHFGLERKTAGARSPLVLSGLVLAGANRPETPARGILTAEAVVSLRLEDLELAVLSACETGLGETAGGEGVYGLQRAFHVAGARNVIASLWRVDDDATAALMIVFYYNLWLEKRAPLQALREAQLHIYRHPEEIKGLAALRGIDFNAKDLPKVTPTPAAKDAHAHVSQWAAFMLSGTGR